MLLIREADAWRAVLSLHSATVGAARQLVHSEEIEREHTIYNDQDDRSVSRDARESSYCTALTSLASQCDNLHTECIKLRAMRKTKRSVEVTCLAEIVRSSSDEIMAIGQSLATNAALEVSTVTSEVRMAIQQQRNQVSQLRVLLDAVRTAGTLPLPRESKLVIGVARDGHETQFYGLDELLQDTYSKARDINESSLSDALARVFLRRDTQHAKDVQTKRFARRPVDQDQPRNSTKASET